MARYTKIKEGHEMKGTAPIIVALLMVLIIIGTSLSFFFSNQQLLEKYGLFYREELNHTIIEGNAKFKIEDAGASKATLKNIGETNLNCSAFAFYYNKTDNEMEMIDVTPVCNAIKPGEKGDFTFDQPFSEDYLLRVTGPYNTVDERAIAL